MSWRSIGAACALLAGVVSGCGGDGGASGPDGGGDGSAQADASTPPDGGGDAAAKPDACAPYTPPKCDAAPPDPGPKRAWRHTSSSITAAIGFANHRGRDMFYNPGDTQWIIGKFAYGVLDDDIKDEEIDVWLLRDCGTSWEKLGTALTTKDTTHPTTEGVPDTGGRIYFTIPKGKELGQGRHRLRLVVAGDLSAAEMFVEVVPKGTKVFASDVDGTLTTSESVEYQSILTGQISNPNPDSAAALRALADKGYRPFYLTARPEFLVRRTREFLDVHGFPPGLVHTTTGLTGATGNAAIAYKSGELAALAARTSVPAWAFGNTDSDAAAYDATMILPKDHRVFFQYTDAAFGGRRIEAYAELLAPFAQLSPVCLP